MISSINNTDINQIKIENNNWISAPRDTNSSQTSCLTSTLMKMSSNIISKRRIIIKLKITTMSMAKTYTIPLTANKMRNSDTIENFVSRI